MSPVLAYRAFSDSVDVFFRTEGRFATRNSEGGTVPGEITVADAEDNHDGYGPQGAGVPGGRCYVWRVDGGTLSKRRPGDWVRVTFRLRHTAAQERTVTLRQEPSSAPNSKSLNRDLAKIGC